jgi:hypothetical protein
MNEKKIRSITILNKKKSYAKGQTNAYKEKKRERSTHRIRGVETSHSPMINHYNKKKS